MNTKPIGWLAAASLLFAAADLCAAQKAPAKRPPLGLPPLPTVAGNPQTPEKIALGKKLFEDKRFSATGEVSCSKCHEPTKAFTDSPLKTSEGIRKLPSSSLAARTTCRPSPVK
jgi:cytochrome c peroxidase